MSFVDWLITLCPVVIVVFIGIKAQKYVKSVSDFLSAGRLAGRYVVAVAGGEAAMGLITIIAMFEAYYQSGLAYSFWNSMATPIAMIFLLTGYCIYRYRETRAMTMGQFFEIRYSRPFRIFAGILQSISGVINYAIFPAVGARFFVYYCDLPLSIDICGFPLPTFMLVMAILLGVAVVIAIMGGQLTIMVTDCVQGILSYPLYAIIVIYILTNYSWFDDIAPTMLNRPAGESMLNPFDISKLRNFNLFYVCVGIFASIFNRMAWSGTQGYNSAALNAHEQKMSQVIGMWRNGFSSMMYVLLAVAAFAFLNNSRFHTQADVIRNNLAVKAMNDVAGGQQHSDMQTELDNYIKTGKLSTQAKARIAKVDAEYDRTSEEICQRKIKYGLSVPDKIAQTKNAKIAEDREPVLNIAKKLIQSEGAAQKGKAHTFVTIFGQMRVPMTLKYILPIGITGVFCAICIFLLVSTDTTYLHSWGSIIVQDVILPIRGKPFTPRQQLMLLRIVIAFVAIFAFIFSSFFSQVDFILMFFAITGAIWLGGAGPCIIGGLYWNRGTTAGAFAALICGSSLAVGGIILQQVWASHVIPWLEAKDLIGSAAIIFETASRPFEPYIQWRMNLEKFPINSQEIFFFAMVLSLTMYVIVSLLTCREPFNLERMLHRGKYRREGDMLVHKKLTFRNAISKLVGIDSQYTRGDKTLAWSVFIFSMGWGFGSFLTIVIWNKISPWPKEWWATWYFIAIICMSGVIAAISTVWFTIGGTWDLYHLFKRLSCKETSVLDDGRVVGHVSADDIELVEKIDNIEISEAHREEQILMKELKKENSE